MTTLKFKMISSAVVGIIVTLVALVLINVTWGLASDDIVPFICLCAIIWTPASLLVYGLQSLLEKKNPNSYENFTKKVTAFFCKISKDICEE